VLRLYSILQPPKDGLFAMPLTFYLSTTSLFQTFSFGTYIKFKNDTCKVYPAPFAVYLNKDNKTYVEPDISVICDKDKIDDKGCNGAPDFIIEIISLSTKRKDYGIKSFKYRSSGVREYWIINPLSRTINVFDFEHNDENSNSYTFDDEITSCIYTDFKIRLADYV
jgi:Uma2 family endonuclease